MLKSFLEFTSRVLWVLGLQRASVWFLVKTIHTTDLSHPVIHLQNKVGPTLEGMNLKVVYEDKEFIAEYGEALTGRLALGQRPYDVN